MFGARPLGLISALFLSLAVIGATSCATDSLGTFNEDGETDDGGLTGRPGDDLDPIDPDDTNVTPNTCQTGAIMGRLCLPGSDQALSQAVVRVLGTDCLGTTTEFQVTAADNGQFSMAGLPAGDHTVYVDHPSLSATFDVTVLPGEIVLVDTTDPSQPLCLGNDEPRLAIIAGAFDSVDVVLDGLELEYHIYDDFGFAGSPSEAYSFLMDLDQMLDYDVIFFNCGGLDRDFLSVTGDMGDYSSDGTLSYNFSSTIYNNLRAYISHGHSIYASDWAWPIVEGIRQEAVNWYGGEEYDANEVVVGEESDVYGKISDPDLQLFMATPSVAIDYDLGGWAVIDSVHNQVNVFVRGDVTVSDWNTGMSYDLMDKPLLIGYRPFPNSGYVLYTTFHYHSQPSEQMLDILRYMIFQL